MKKVVLILLSACLLLCSACNVRLGTPKATPLPDPMPLSIKLGSNLKASLEGWTEEAVAEELNEEKFDDPNVPRERTITMDKTEYTLNYKQSVRSVDGSVRHEYAVKDVAIPITVLYADGKDTPYGASIPAVIVPVNLRTLDPADLVTTAEKLLGGEIPEEIKKYNCVVTRNDDGMTEFTFYEQLEGYRHVIAQVRYVGTTVTLTIVDEFPEEADIAVLIESKDDLWEQVKAAVPSAEESGDPYVTWTKDGPMLIVTYTTDSGTYRYRLYQE